MRFRRIGTRLLLLLFTLVATAIGVFAWQTRPAALRARLDAALMPSGFVVRDVEELSFTPWGGLTARNLELIAREAAATDEPSTLHVPLAQLSVCWRSALIGHVSPETLRLERPSLMLVLDDLAGRATASSGPAAAESLRRGSGLKFARLPAVDIEQCDVKVHTRVDGQLRLLRRWVVDCTGEPQADQTYNLHVTQIAGPSMLAPGTSRDGRTLAEVTIVGQKLTARSDWLDLETLKAVGPAALADILRDGRAAGMCRVERLVLDGSRLDALTLQFSNLDIAPSLDDGSIGPIPDHRYLTFRQAVGEARFLHTPGKEQPGDLVCGNLALELRGMLNGGTFATGLTLRSFAFGRTPGGDATEFGLRAAGYDGHVRIDRLEFPDPQVHPELTESRRVPGPLRAVLRDYAPLGNANVHATFSAPENPFDASAGYQVRFDGAVELAGASLRYFRFPYRVEQIFGNICFSNDGVTIEHVVGRRGSAVFVGNGDLDNTRDWTGFRLAFDAESLPLDQHFYDALPARYHALWDQANPIGLADVSVRLQREDGSEQTGFTETQTTISARLRSASLSLSPQARLMQATGWIDIDDNGLRIRELQGFDGGAHVRVEGSVMPETPEHAKRQDIHFEAFGMAVDHAQDIRAPDGARLGELRLKATADVWGQLSGPLGGGDDQYTALLRDGTLSLFAPDDPFHDVSGLISSNGTVRTIETLTARRGDARIGVSGILGEGGGKGGTIRVVADDPQMQRLMAQLIPVGRPALRDALALSGPGSMRLEVTLPADGSPRVEANISAASLSSSKLPLALRDVRHTLMLEGDSFRVSEFAARVATGGQISGSGSGCIVGESMTCDMQLEATGVQVDSALAAAMPTGLRSLLEGLELSGVVDVELTRCHIAAGEEPSRFEGRIRVASGDMNIGLPLKAFAGVIEGAVEVNGERGVFVDARFVIDEGKLEGRAVSGLRGQIRRDYGESRVRFESIGGGFCDGHITGGADYDVATRGYNLNLRFGDACFNTFRGTDPDAHGPMRRGRMDGELYLKGVGGDVSRRTGGGRMRVRGTSLLSTAVTAKVLDAARGASRALEENVEQAELRFTWDGQTIDFARVDIQSRTSRLVGNGRWNNRDDVIDMLLLSAPPVGSVRVPGLSDLIETAGQELVQYRVEGKASQPRVRVEPLHNLTEPIRQLLRGN
ncbi:MAG: hypothetical protein ACKVS9_09275 [Phycisphaerae bacterium]